MDGPVEKIENLLEIRDQEHVVVQVGLLVTLYFKGAHKETVKESVLQCMNEYRLRYGRSLRWTKHPQTATFYPIDSTRVPSPKEWLSRLTPGAAWEFEFRGGDAASDANAFSVKVLGRADRGKDELSYLRATLPMTYFTQHGGKFSDLVLFLCQQIDPTQGYGGLGILESPDEAIADQHEPVVFQIAQRFPGLEVDHPTSHIRYLREGVKGANWMVVLGEPWLQRIGGADVLRNALSSEFILMEYAGGILIQAGPRPQMGDTDKGVVPELYVRLAQVLKPIRITRHRMFHHGGPDRFDQATSEAWLARFDKLAPQT